MVKKYLIVLLLVLMLMPLVGALNSMPIEKNEIKSVKNSMQYFTHTVMAEYATMTTCPPCVQANSQLYSIYNSGDLDFYYVTMVYDEGNFRVIERLKELGVSSVPDVYFDGGYKRVLGGQSSENPYRYAITQCGERDVPDIDVDVDAEWKGNAIIKIKVTVQNNEPGDYNGILRVYITEKESRWNDYGGNPYHFGVLDIPMDRSLAVSKSQDQPMPLGDTYTFTKTWFGSLFGFGDISKGNIMVIAAVFDSNTGYAVQADAKEPAENSEHITSHYVKSYFSMLFCSIRNHYKLDIETLPNFYL